MVIMFYTAHLEIGLQILLWRQPFLELYQTPVGCLLSSGMTDASLIQSTPNTICNENKCPLGGSKKTQGWYTARSPCLKSQIGLSQKAPPAG